MPFIFFIAKHSRLQKAQQRTHKNKKQKKRFVLFLHKKYKQSISSVQQHHTRFVSSSRLSIPCCTSTTYTIVPVGCAVYHTQRPPPPHTSVGCLLCCRTFVVAAWQPGGNLVAVLRTGNSQRAWPAVGKDEAFGKAPFRPVGRQGCYCRNFRYYKNILSVSRVGLISWRMSRHIRGKSYLHTSIFLFFSGSHPPTSTTCCTTPHTASSFFCVDASLLRGRRPLVAAEAKLYEAALN